MPRSRSPSSQIAAVMRALATTPRISVRPALTFLSDRMILRLQFISIMELFHYGMMCGMAASRETPETFELMVRMRALTVESDRFAERFAASHGLHRTDLNALVVILDAARAGRPLTPGGLGAALNLSPPATTAL